MNNNKFPLLKPLKYDETLKERTKEIRTLCYDSQLNYFEVIELLEIVIEQRNVKEILKKIKK